LAQRFNFGVREKAHIISEACGTVKTAFELQSSFTKLQEMGDGDEKQEMEEKAARKGMEALWRGSKLEVESVLRQVCDKVLGDESVEIEMRRRRGVALKVLGEVYQNAD
jgi:X-domain of DnaJ-containing